MESHAQVRERVPGEILNELQKSGDSSEIEDGVRKFVEWIKSGKLEVRAYPSERVHAKLYIMTFHEGDRDKGRVITGSSNFTEAGLQDNLEFNVELKNRSDYDFALQKFNELWAKSVDVTKDYVTTIEVKSPYAQFTPYELYLKFLYEYFRGELNLPDEIEDMYLPTGFKKLKYQEEAVLNARKVLDEYGGAFLSDVVGLGKTYMSALLAQQLNEPCLVIAPPHLLDEHNPGSWPNVFREFGVRGYLCESLGKLESLLERDLSKYTTVFIDESHRFRTEDTQSYEMLAQICRGKTRRSGFRHAAEQHAAGHLEPDQAVPARQEQHHSRMSAISKPSSARSAASSKDSTGRTTAKEYFKTVQENARANPRENSQVPDDPPHPHGD